MQKINKKDALERLNTIEAEAKKLRVILNRPENILERVKTISDACEEIGCIMPENLDPYKQAEDEIKIFAEALREGKPAGECFYYPYFKRSSGGGFSFYVCVFAFDYSYVGARLRVDTPEKAIHLGKCMLENYKIMDKG